MKPIYLTLTLIAISMTSGLLSGCRKDDDDMEPRAVIQGTISNGNYPDVIFSSSVIPGIDGNLADAVVNWGKVTISDGKREIVLTGRADNAYMPPFHYYTQEMKGEAGKTYTIKADFKNLHAEAIAYLPFPTPIDSVTLAPTSNDSLRAATLHFTAPEDTPAYYYVTLRKLQGKGPDMPSLSATIRADIPRSHYSLPVLRPKINLDSTKYFANLKIGEEWIVNLNRVEKAVFDFWSAYDNMTLFSASPFISSDESLPSNISGGFGVWSPQGTSSLFLQVK